MLTVFYPMQPHKVWELASSKQTKNSVRMSEHFGSVNTGLTCTTCPVFCALEGSSWVGLVHAEGERSMKVVNVSWW